MATLRRRRLLFLAPVTPADRGNGLAMRVGFFLNAYAREFDVDLAVFPIVSGAASPLDAARQRVRRTRIFAHPGLDTHFRLLTALDDPAARLDAFRRYGRPSLASFASEIARHALDDWTQGESYDAVHVSRLYLAALVDGWALRAHAARPALVIDCDEDDARAYRRLAAIERRHGRQRQAAWAIAEAEAFEQLAQRTLPRFDLAFAASAEESKSISTRGVDTVPVPNVASLPAPSGRPRRRGGQIVLFVGTMGYAPNEDGALWLVTRVWPHLKRAVSTPLRLVLAGSNPKDALMRLGRSRGVTVTGTVADIGEYYRQADLVVIPIHAGGGTRIKLLEAAAWGVPVVSTGFGAAGTAFNHDRELLMANNAEQFARACAVVLQNRALAGRLAAAARRRVAREYDPAQWGKRVIDAVTGLAGGRASVGQEQGLRSDA